MTMRDRTEGAIIAATELPAMRRYQARLDAAVLELCERYGFGAVMQSASEQWRQRDPVGAIALGECYGTIETRRAKRKRERTPTAQGREDRRESAPNPALTMLNRRPTITDLNYPTGRTGRHLERTADHAENVPSQEKEPRP